MPSTEIILIPTSEAYQADPNVLKNGLGPLSKVDGLESIYYGVHIDDPKTGFIINNWTAFEDFERFIKDPKFRDILSPLAPAAAGPSSINNVEFVSDFSKIFAFPITEIAFATLHSQESKQKLSDLLAELGRLAGGLATYGQLKEKDDVLVFITGWESVEHQQEIAGSPTFQAIIGQLPGLAKLDVKLTRLTKYSN